jgi:hypothetical protein
MYSKIVTTLGLGIAALHLLFGFNIALAADKSRSPAVVELFTSQGCYSCPPAEAYLGKLSKRSDVVALEYHVDYWDDLVYGLAGKWKDPFSSPDFTRRQRQYNTVIRKTSGVYTPQMVIAGTLETVGSHEDKVEKAISVVSQTGTSPLSVHVKPDNSGQLLVRIDGRSASSAPVWLVRFHKSVETVVRSGENKGKTLISHNIVNGVERIGEWNGTPLTLTATLPSIASGEGCAILVQKKTTGTIFGANYCPVGSSS